jgi:hypothetical protein
MLKISVIDNSTQRRLTLEGRLAASRLPEMGRAWNLAKVDLGSRELIVDLKRVTAISEEGESALLDLMNQGATVAWATPKTAPAWVGSVEEVQARTFSW